MKSARSANPERVARARAEKRSSGCLMPAEWERHEAVWLAWPHDTSTFPRLREVEEAYVHFVAAVHRGEEVRLLARDESMRARAARLLGKAGVDLGHVRFFVHQYADVWYRDYGPTFVLDRKSGGKAMVHWIFNAWGRKYAELIGDTRVPERMLSEFPMPCLRPGIVLEGGSIDVNGKGAMLTTEQCLLNKNRNPGLNRGQIEKYLADYLGADHVIWLKEGIAGDDTDGHVDDIARFTAPDTVVCAYEDDKSDVNYAALRRNYELLLRSKDQEGHPLRVIKLPMPGTVNDEHGRLPASYANFFIGNSAVLVPVFGHANDAKALDVIQEAFPGRKVVGIRCEHMVRGLGALHCISQQEPAL
jgi:agmatine deiminase